MKKAMKYLWLPAFALVLLLTACNEEDNYTEGAADKPGTDITELDGKVTTLQTATEGNGVNIILMGDGFTAAEINAGEYDEAMNKAMEALFIAQPMKGLRKYFNVYSVQKVSVSNVLNGQTVLGSITDGDLISGNPTTTSLDGKTLLYAALVPEYNVENTYVGVVMNTELRGGITSYPNSWANLACSYCTYNGSIDGDEFRQTMIHELAGHGIGKLLDEYVPRSGGFTLDEIDGVRYGQSIGWYQNIWIYNDYDFTTPWTAFVDDPRYADEQLADPRVWPDDFNDLYYISCDPDNTSWLYRPSANSIMQDVESPGMTFNAPSRRAIYNNVMKVATGDTPSYEDFVTFDMANR